MAANQNALIGALLSEAVRYEYPVQGYFTGATNYPKDRAMIASVALTA